MITEDQAVSLLRKHSSDEQTFKKVVAHSKAVQAVALRIAERIPRADKEFISIACLLHDIGRFECGPRTEASIFHGMKGAEILRREGLPRFARVAECHIGAGIRKEDIIRQRLPLPKRDFVPLTIEEKIIAHADNLVFGDREGTMDEVRERFLNEFGPEALAMVEKLKDEIDNEMEGGER